MVSLTLNATELSFLTGHAAAQQNQAASELLDRMASTHGGHDGSLDNVHNVELKAMIAVIENAFAADAIPAGAKGAGSQPLAEDVKALLERLRGKFKPLDG